MAELHPVMVEALAAFVPTQTKDRDAIAAYQEVIAYENRTTSEDAAQPRLLLWADDQEALGLLLAAAQDALSDAGAWRYGTARTRRDALRLADTLDALLDRVGCDESLLALASVSVDEAVAE